MLSAFAVFLTDPQIFYINSGVWEIIVAGCGVAVILAREIIVSGFRMVAADSGYVIAADMVGKYKTVTQDASIIVLLIGAGVCAVTKSSAGDIIRYIGLALFALAVVLTVISGLNYIIKNIQVLKQ